MLGLVYSPRCNSSLFPLNVLDRTIYHSPSSNAFSVCPPNTFDQVTKRHRLPIDWHLIYEYNLIYYTAHLMIVVRSAPS